MPATFRCYQLKPSKDAWKRCINLMSPKYSVLVAENKGFSSRNYLGLLVVDLGLFCQASRGIYFMVESHKCTGKIHSVYYVVLCLLPNS